MFHQSRKSKNPPSPLPPPPSPPQKKNLLVLMKVKFNKTFLCVHTATFSAHYGGLGRLSNLVPRPLQGREGKRPFKRGWGMGMGGNVEATISLGTLRSDNGDVNEEVTEK